VCQGYDRDVRVYMCVRAIDFVSVSKILSNMFNLFNGEVYIQHLAALKERHERRMACLLKLQN
jgi:hypothetical protein